MKGEIRDLKTGVYHNKDGSAALKISKTDQGVRVELIDFEFDLWEAWTLADEEVTAFEWGSIRSAQEEDMKNQES